MDNPKQPVYNSYQKIVQWFDEHRFKGLMERPYLNLIRAHIPPQGTILDLGCGTGEPIAKFFTDQGYIITGVDGSRGMIELCQRRFPQANWLVADMRELHLHQQFDVILAWHSLFHLNHDDQRAMFQTFQSHIKPGGILAFTSGFEHGEEWSDNGGQNLYHASLASEEYQNLLEKHNFNVICHNQEDPACGDATVWVARARE